MAYLIELTCFLIHKYALTFSGGAWDGEAESNTLLFELKREWKGLLIEPNKGPFINDVTPLILFRNTVDNHFLGNR